MGDFDSAFSPRFELIVQSGETEIRVSVSDTDEFDIGVLASIQPESFGIGVCVRWQSLLQSMEMHEDSTAALHDTTALCSSMRYQVPYRHKQPGL